MPSDRRRKKKSGVIEHPPALRLHRRRRAGSPSERAAAPTQRMLLRAESRYYAAVPCPSFLPSFLSLPNDVFPAIGFPREQWPEKRTKRRGGERRSRGKGRKARGRKKQIAHILFSVYHFFLRLTICIYAQSDRGKGRGREQTEER